MPFTVFQPFEFESDQHSLTIKLTGGMKAWQRSPNEWSIGPVLCNGQIVLAGILSFAELQAGICKMELRQVILEHRVVVSGITSVTRRSVDPVSPNSPLSATDIWQTIRGNLRGDRLRRFKKEFPEAGREEIIAFIEQNTREENLCGYISDSLRSMDICISAIGDYYHDQLTAFLHRGRTDGQRSADVADLPFVANVHSFFVHLGAARDYLAALVAHRCGLSDDTDGMSRLVDRLRWDKLPADPVLNHLIESGSISARENSTKARLSGWLEEVSNVRNELVHRRPYGSHDSEAYGHIQMAGDLEGHYRFFKPIVLNSMTTTDTLDYLTDVYSKIVALFGQLALVSGRKTDLPVLTGEDMISFTITTGNPAGENR